MPHLVKFLLYVVGVVSVVAVISIVAFFTVGEPWGTINDFSYGVMMLGLTLLLPALRPVYTRSTSGTSRAARILGAVSIPGFSILSFLQSAQGAGLISFRSIQPIPGLGPFALGVLFFLLFEIWLLMFGVVLKRSGVKNAIKVSLVSMTGLAFPVWPFWLARQSAIWAPADPLPRSR